MRVALLLAGLFLLAAPSANAATLSVTRDPDEHFKILHIESKSRARNAVTVTRDRPPGREGLEMRPTHIIRDPGERLRMGRGAHCTRSTPHKARCEWTDIVEVELGPGNDAAKLRDKPYRKPTFFGPSDVHIAGGKGDDTLRAKASSLDGGRGDDVIRGLGSLTGGPGDDRIRGGRTRDILSGGEGNDVLHGGPQRDELYGGYYVDDVSAPAGRDRLDGGSGDDFFEDDDRGPSSRVDADRLIGGRGDDSVSYHAAHTPVFVNLTRPGGAGERGEDDVLTGLEQVIGGDAGDELIGDSDSNFFDGGAGRDVVRARGGDDEIWAADADEVHGQAGEDEIVLLNRTADAEVDCGAGLDVVTQPVLDPYPPGVFVPSNCQRVRVRTYSSQGVPEKVAIGPVPELAASDELTFAIFNFSCCEYRLSVTEPADPFTELGSAPVDSEHVSVPLPAETADRARHERVELRAALYGSGPEPVLIWRFVPEAP
jgi:hypothetical protein